MFRSDDPKRYWRHLREGWPIVLSVLAITVAEHTLDSALHFGLTPLGLLGLASPGPFAPHEVTGSLWLVLTWALFVVTVFLYVTDHPAWEAQCGMVVLIVSSLGLITNVGELVRSLPQRVGADGMALLLDGSLIWASNILIFTIWYWLVDGGGYLRRSARSLGRREFLFPLQATPQEGYPDWRPHYVDYLFLALTTSMAFSPTDTQTLSWRAKLLQGAQALISLVVTALIVARAVNILTTG
jgi:uncharacterized membrane protein